MERCVLSFAAEVSSKSNWPTALWEYCISSGLRNNYANTNYYGRNTYSVIQGLLDICGVYCLTLGSNTLINNCHFCEWQASKGSLKNCHCHRTTASRPFLSNYLVIYYVYIFLRTSELLYQNSEHEIYQSKIHKFTIYLKSNTLSIHYKNKSLYCPFWNDLSLGRLILNPWIFLHSVCQVQIFLVLFVMIDKATIVTCNRGSHRVSQVLCRVRTEAQYYIREDPRQFITSFDGHRLAECNNITATFHLLPAIRR